MRHKLWQVWIFISTFYMLPFGVWVWWFEPFWIPRPWSYLIAGAGTYVAIFMVRDWLREHYVSSNG